MTDPLRVRLTQFQVSHAPTRRCAEDREHYANACQELAAELATPEGDDLTSLRDECERMLTYASKDEAPAWRQIIASISQRLAARAVAPQEPSNAK